MSDQLAFQEQCPYCRPPYEGFCDDHVFPQFLGGRRTIRVCRECNNAFGHTFEGEVSKQLARLQVFISHFGLDLSRNSALWRAALTVDDKQLDLTSGPEGAQYHLSKPVIYRDEKGRITGGQARSMSEANKIAKGMIKSNAAKEVEVAAATGPILEEIKLNVALSFDDSLFRFCTKLVSAVTVASGHLNLISASGIPAYLHGEGAWSAKVAYCDVKPLLKLKPPLAHTVYVELGEESYGLVLLFGFKRVFVPLPRVPVRRGILASLDPISGEEAFNDVDPIGPREIPTVNYKDSALAHLQDMLNILSEDAILRGAKKKPELYVGDSGLRTSLPSWWNTSTVRYMFPKFPPR